MKKLILLLGVALLLFASCRKEFERPGWNTDVLTPIVKSSLTIADIVDDSVLVVDEDSCLSLIFSTDLYSTSLDSLVALNFEGFTKNEKLDSIQLEEPTIVRNISLGEIASDAGPIGALIIAQNGSTSPIPPVNGITAGPFEINATDLFETITLSEGFMDITIFNGFPTDISNLNYELKNASDGAVVASGSIPYIASLATEQQTIDIGGSTVEGVLSVEVTNLDIVGTGGNPVLIDTSDAIQVTVEIRDITIEAATAIFPAQNVIEEVAQDTVQGLGDVELKEAIIASGFVQISVVSTIQDQLFFDYSIPSATLDGIPFQTNTVVPAAPVGQSTSVQFTYAMDGYHFDFTGQQGDAVNTFYSELIGSIEFTGEIVSLSLEDSILIDLQIVDLIPEYVRGYLGQQTFEIGPSSANFDFLQGIQGGDISLTGTEIRVNVNNALGVGADVVLNEITAQNTNSGSQVALDLSALPMSTLSISPATDFPLTPFETQHIFDDVSSNSSNFLEIIPDQLDYALDVTLNPDGFQGTYTDFAYRDENLDADLEVEIPLAFIANDLVLEDTAEFINLEVGSIDQVGDGIFTFVVDNGFPIEATLSVYFLDATANVFDSLVTDERLLAAPVDADFKVVDAQRSKLNFPVGKSRLPNLLNADKIILRTSFVTRPEDLHMKIYSDYSISFTLVGDFEYEMN